MADTKHFVIITGGECKADGIPDGIADNAYIIAADSGYDTAKRIGITPDLLVGDMDSIRDVPSGIETLRVKAEKDDTDTMLAISIAKEKGAHSITVIGGAGGRADLMDGVNEIFVLTDGCVKIPNRGGYFGLLALEDSVVTAKGCKYPLEDHLLRRTLPYAVSNEVTSDFAEINVKGKIIVTVSAR